MSALARAMSLNPSTISRWEDGASAPEPEMLLKLAQHLQVRPEYFTRPTSENGKPVFFRSLSSALVKDREYQKSQMKWLKEISQILENYVDFPEFSIPPDMMEIDYKTLRDEDIESIALELRDFWRIGHGPCVDIIETLENLGFILSSIKMGTVKLDGLCNWSEHDERPHILLASDKMSYARRQMDAAHEMAHAILHRNVSEDEFKNNLKEIEAQAFRLAGAFLLPSTNFALDVRDISLNHLVSLKEKWKVSIKAQIKRLAQLELIPEDYAPQMYKMHSARGWSKEEPFDRVWPISKPRTLSDAIHLIVEEGVRSKAELMSTDFAISASDVENLAGLPPGWFSNPGAEIVKLKPHRQPQSGGQGEVVPFKPRE